MMPRRSNRRLTALVAVFAIALQALWPLLSHARPQDPTLLVPVCTIDGISHYLDLKTGKAPLDERSAQHGEHCKFCVFGDGKVVALVAPGFLPFLFGNFANQVPAIFEASFYQATLPSAQPRAPPAVS